MGSGDNLPRRTRGSEEQGVQGIIYLGEQGVQNIVYLEELGGQEINYLKEQGV